SVGRSYSGD
ncbi:hypothetical protein CISIN_1g0093332mg, partial [Citrus sinensis]